MLYQVELFLLHNMICVQLRHCQLPCHQQLYPKRLKILLNFAYPIQSCQYYSIVQEIFNHFLNHQFAFDFPSKNCFPHNFSNFLYCFQSPQSFPGLQRPLDVRLDNPNILDAVLNPSMPDKLSDYLLHILYQFDLFVMCLWQQDRFYVLLNYSNCPSFSLFLFQVYVFHKQWNQFMTFYFQVLVKCIVLFHHHRVS